MFLGIGIEASVDGESHRLMTYLVWYGVSAVLIAIVILLTTLIERRKAAAQRAGRHVHVQHAPEREWRVAHGLG